jgi:signal transduction histidine kinase/GAF domain-containing protein
MKINRRRALQPAVADLSSTPIDGDAFVQAALPLVGRFGNTTTLTIRDLANEAPQLAEMTGLACMLAMPIVTNNQTIGVIWVGWRQAHEWQSREISLLSILATQLNQALARAQLLLSEQERRQVADTLRETAQMFTRLLTLEGIYELIFDQLARVLHYDTASLLMRNNGYLEVIGGRGFSARSRITDLRFQLSDDANLRYVVETKRPMVLEDAQLSPYFVVVPDTEHIHGWIAAPLLVDDEVIGLLCADNRIPGSYDEEDGEIAFALASQAAQAIRNARLYAEVTQLNTALEQRVAERTAQLQDEQDRLRAVHAITVELTATLELELTLNRALELAADAVEAKRGSIMLHDLQNDKLTCRAILSGNQVESTDIPINFAQGGGLAGWVIRTREAVCIPDVLTDPRWLQIEGRADEARSVIAAPLLTQDGPLGVIMLSSPNVNFFQDAQVQLLTTIANEVAIVIHNATLYKVISELAYERGIAEAQQREENSKNQAILQSLDEGVLVLDEQNHVVLFNPAAESMLGIPASYVSGRPLRHLLQYDESFVQSRRASQVYEGLSLGLQALNEQGRNHNRSLTLANPLQTIALSFSPWVGPRGATFGSVVVLRDVTREIESDRAKREFISSVSHELRTPLTSIKGYVDLLLLNAAGPLNEGQLSFLSVVKNNANRLMDLINDILEIGRIDSEKIQLNFEEVDIRQIFQDSLQTMRIQIDRKEMEVSVDVAEQVPLIIADQRRISQVVLNLTSNAVKYTFPKGQITLRAFLNPAGMLQVEVQDTGVGISEEDQKNLFRRFQRFDNPLRDEAGGTGLGLSIAKSFVELHGGEMWVTSTPGQGSTFHFIIPVSQLNQQLLLRDNA